MNFPTALALQLNGCIDTSRDYLNDNLQQIVHFCVIGIRNLLEVFKKDLFSIALFLLLILWVAQTLNTYNFFNPPFLIWEPLIFQSLTIFLIFLIQRNVSDTIVIIITQCEIWKKMITDDHHRMSSF